MSGSSNVNIDEEVIAVITAAIAEMETSRTTGWSYGP